MTRLLVLLLIAASLHAQGLYAPTRPTMRRGPELATVSPSRQAAIAKALIDPDPHDLIVLLGLPDLWPQREPVLLAATPKQPPPQPMVKPSQNSTACHVDGQIICPNPSTPVQPPVTNLVQPIAPQPPDAGGRIAGWPFPDGPPRNIPQSPPQPIVPTTGGVTGTCRDCATGPSNLSSIVTRPPASIVQPLPGPVLTATPDSILVTVSPMSQIATERTLGKRLAQASAPGKPSRAVVMGWLVTLESRASEPVSILPSAVYRHIAHLQPVDYVVMTQLIEDAVKNSLLARIGRGADDTGKLTAFMIAAKTIRITETWPGALLNGALWGIPYFIGRLKGAEVPVASNYAQLAWVGPVQLGPFETAFTHVYTQTWDNPTPISFSLDVSSVAPRKSLQ